MRPQPHVVVVVVVDGRLVALLLRRLLRLLLVVVAAAADDVARVHVRGRVGVGVRVRGSLFFVAIVILLLYLDGWMVVGREWELFIFKPWCKV